MKRNFILSICTGALLTLAAVPDSTPNDSKSCTDKSLKQEAISSLTPFHYASSKVNFISFDYKAKKQEIAVPLFKGEQYKFVFNRKGLPQNVEIEIYNHPMSANNRHKLFSSEGNTDDIITFEPKHAHKMYINYVIPKAEQEGTSGCIAMSLGYKLNFIKEDK